jgi:hypothetical protein
MTLRCSCNPGSGPRLEVRPAETFLSPSTSHATPSLLSTASASEAYHYRFSYSDTPQTEAYFSWTSLDGESPAEVQLGTESGKYVHLYSAETVTYAASDLCSSGSGYKDPGYCASPREGSTAATPRRSDAFVAARSIGAAAA